MVTSENTSRKSSGEGGLHVDRVERHALNQLDAQCVSFAKPVLESLKASQTLELAVHHDTDAITGKLALIHARQNVMAWKKQTSQSFKCTYKSIICFSNSPNENKKTPIAQV